MLNSHAQQQPPGLLAPSADTATTLPNSSTTSIHNHTSSLPSTSVSSVTLDVSSTFSVINPHCAPVLDSLRLPLSTNVTMGGPQANQENHFCEPSSIDGQHIYKPSCPNTSGIMNPRAVLPPMEPLGTGDIHLPRPVLSEKNTHMLVQCTFIEQDKRCTNVVNTAISSNLCSIHIQADRRALRCAEMKQQQSQLEKKADLLLKRVHRLQTKQFYQHVGKQLQTFVKEEQPKMFITCQHPAVLIRQHAEQHQRLLQENAKAARLKQEKKLEARQAAVAPTLIPPVNVAASLPITPQLPAGLTSVSPSDQTNAKLSTPPENTSHNSGTPVTQAEKLKATQESKSKPRTKESHPVKVSSAIIVNRKQPVRRFSESEAAHIQTSVGVLKTNLRQLEFDYDSDATLSSSGGESGDELDEMVAEICRQQHIPHPGDPCTASIPLRRRSNWYWCKQRSAIAARWTWLQAQVADLEFKIRQQNEMYRQLRVSKGPISFYAPRVHRNSGQAIKTSGNEDSDNEPSSCVRTLPLKQMRKRKMVHAMLALATMGQRRSVRHSSVLCGCSGLPAYAGPCVLCSGRLSYTQMIDTDIMPPQERVALLDSGCHSVLSLPQDSSLGLHFSRLLKRETVQRPSYRTVDRLFSGSPNYKKKKLPMLPKQAPVAANSEFGLKLGKELSKKKKSQAVISSAKLKKKYDQDRSKKKQLVGQAGPKHIRHALKRQHRPNKLGNRTGSPNGASGDPGSRQDSPLPSPLIGSAAEQLASLQRRRRSEQNAFDINNIVIPYSIASTTRVEKLQYKEIITPKWRITEEAAAKLDEEEKIALAVQPDKTEEANKAKKLEEACKVKRLEETIKKPDETLKEESELNLDKSLPRPLRRKSKANSAKRAAGSGLAINASPHEDAGSASDSTEGSEQAAQSDSLEDLSDEIFIERHLKCEVDERRRFTAYLSRQPSGSGGRGRAVRQRTESTRSEMNNALSGKSTLQPDIPSLDCSSQDSFGSMQIHLGVSKGSGKLELVEDHGNSNHATNLSGRSRAVSFSRKTLASFADTDDEQGSDTIEVVPYERRQFPLSESEFHELTRQMLDDDSQVTRELRQEANNGSAVRNRPAPTNPVPTESNGTRCSSSSSVTDEAMDNEDPEWEPK